jgi:hypothetical protein
MDRVVLRWEKLPGILQGKDALERVDGLETSIEKGRFAGRRATTDQDRDALLDRGFNEVIDSLGSKMIDERLFDFSMSTVHADTPLGAYEQLAMMVQQGGMSSGYTRQDLMSYIQMVIPVVIQLRREGGRRGVSEIYYARQGA